MARAAQGVNELPLLATACGAPAAGAAMHAMPACCRSSRQDRQKWSPQGGGAWHLHSEGSDRVQPAVAAQGAVPQRSP